MTPPAGLGAHTFGYDAAGRKISEVDGKESSGTGTTRYVRGPHGTLIGMQDNAGANYYATLDNVGSVLLLTDGSQTTAAAYTYDAYGVTLTSTGPQAGSNHYRYATGYTDPTGLIKLGARCYNPTLGRFTQPDPSGQETNRYVYAGNNPTTYNDPMGLCGEWYEIYDICDNIDTGGQPVDLNYQAIDATCAEVGLLAFASVAFTGMGIGCGVYAAGRVLYSYLD